jgi:hypothetical protein|tara:strand:- start:350 stop:520 length:171 start_codon:yes stop_codon:yes gene_type:complete
MTLETRHKYLTNVFDRLHDKLDDAFETIYDGDFEDCKNTVNSLIYDLKQLKKTMES